MYEFTLPLCIAVCLPVIERQVKCSYRYDLPRPPESYGWPVACVLPFSEIQTQLGGGRAEQGRAWEGMDAAQTPLLQLQAVPPLLWKKLVLTTMEIPRCGRKQNCVYGVKQSCPSLLAWALLTGVLTWVPGWWRLHFSLSQSSRMETYTVGFLELSYVLLVVLSHSWPVGCFSLTERLEGSTALPLPAPAVNSLWPVSLIMQADTCTPLVTAGVPWEDPRTNCENNT